MHTRFLSCVCPNNWPISDQHVPDCHPLFREAEKKSTDVYEKVAWFELEEQYSKTESGRTGMVCVALELCMFHLVLLVVSPIYIGVCFSRAYLERLKNSQVPSNVCHPCIFM